MERKNELIIEDIKTFVTRLEEYARQDEQTASELLDKSEEMANKYLGSAEAYEFAARWLRIYLGDKP